jgi:hypothetical protein
VFIQQESIIQKTLHHNSDNHPNSLCTQLNQRSYNGDLFSRSLCFPSILCIVEKLFFIQIPFVNPSTIRTFSILMQISSF